MSSTPAWTLEHASAVAGEVASRLGLGGELRVIRFRQNAIFQLPDHGLAIRVYGPEAAQQKSEVMLAIARQLEAAGVPAVRPAPITDEQPLRLGGSLVTVWRWIEGTEGPVSYEEFGELLRRFHEAMRDLDHPIGAFAPGAKIERRLDRIEAEALLSAEHLQTLRRAYDEVTRRAAPYLALPAEPVVLHGDAMIGNVVSAPDALTLIDFDSAVRGPVEWDLASAVVSIEGVDPAAAWGALLRGYGVDESELTGVRELTHVKQLSISVVQCLGVGASPEADERARRHLGYWSDWKPDRPDEAFRAIRLPSAL